MSTMTTTLAPPFGETLKQWRRARRFSQLELAATAEVSQRHLSFLETGRSAPSREMVIHLATVLDVPLRDRNRWLASAGYAAAYPERSLDEPAMEQVRHVLDTILTAHEPFPAYVVDPAWNVVMTNQAAGTLIARFVNPADAAAFGGNVLRLSLHPDGLRPHLVNWEEAAGALLDRLSRETAERPMDQALAALFEEVSGYPGVADLAGRSGVSEAADLMVPLHFRFEAGDLRLFTTITTIGAPYDVTLEELRLETLLPADADSESLLRRLAG
jgi:transcriptional regulator with XRE-family HTH domain